MFRLAMVLIIAGLSFRLTAVPFHFYAPDVFQGVTTSSAAMLSFVPKVVGFTALLRLLPVCFGEAGFYGLDARRCGARRADGACHSDDVRRQSAWPCDKPV